MLEKLPEVQMEHSLSWELVRQFSRALMPPWLSALATSHPAMPISFCFKNNRRSFSEHCRPAQVQVLGDGSPETTIPQGWVQLQQQTEPQQFSRRERSKLFSREAGKHKRCLNLLQDSQMTIWRRRNSFP